MQKDQALCKICGEPMPKGEEMFFYHGSSGPCPKPPLPKTKTIDPKDKIISDLEARVREYEVVEEKYIATQNWCYSKISDLEAKLKIAVEFISTLPCAMCAPLGFQKHGQNCLHLRGKNLISQINEVEND